GFFVSLASSLLRGKRTGRFVALCGGCLMILTVIRPLMQVNLSALPDLVTGLTLSERQTLAQEKNNAILRNLVEAQTVSWLETQAKQLGMAASFSVHATQTAEGLWIPDQVRISGSWTEQQRQSLSTQMMRELSVPPERQEWEGG
ncbi:MAG: hypothetical protein IIY70_01845, partial [Oscillospiraceae bacterium]|nr:hypothetical protein [Oscillospiraceae bacterium]